jgi:hypothetical protein
MKYVLGTWNCQKCGSTRIASVSETHECEICSDRMRFQSVRPRVGEVLRRWTTDAASSIGGQVKARVRFEDPLVADVRRLHLQLLAVASKLAAAKSLGVAESR